AKAIDQVIEQYGKLDGLVCNAAARDRRPIDEIEPEDFRALLETNLVSPFELARIAARHMVERGSGRIIMLTSLAGDFAYDGDPIYPGTKAGLSGIVRALAVSLGRHGVNVNGIAPGPVASEMNKSLTEDPDWTAMIERNVPLRRWADPEELAGAAIFLASDASSYVNGHIITVDGGTSVKLFS
ncbi:MAG: SDR family oxidoreductase, partial [Pseudomonadota bacterium]